MIIPSIDLMNGKAVQLVKGERKVIEIEDVLGLAEKFSSFKEIAVIDLDAALGNGSNIEIIKKVCKIANCRIGGGIRNYEKAIEILKAGSKKIIIGTMANKEFLEKLPKDSIIAAIDSKKGFVVNKGWKEKTDKKPEEVVKELNDYCSGFLYTCVDKEGLMKGTDIKKAVEISKLTNKKITVAGGISTIEEIKKLSNLGFDCQIGMALYTGKIKLDDLVEIDRNLTKIKNFLRSLKILDF